MMSGEVEDFRLKTSFSALTIKFSKNQSNFAVKYYSGEVLLYPVKILFLTVEIR
jgi:hypothetical protein